MEIRQLHVEMSMTKHRSHLLQQCKVSGVLGCHKAISKVTRHHINESRRLELYYFEHLES